MRHLRVITILLLASALAALPKKDLGKFTPFDLVVKPMAVDDTHPAGSNELVFKIRGLPRGTDAAPWAVEIEKKIGDRGGWVGVSFVKSSTYLDEYKIGNDTYRFEQIWNEPDWTPGTVISYRVRVAACDSTFSAIANSPWSKVARSGK